MVDIDEDGMDVFQQVLYIPGLYNRYCIQVYITGIVYRFIYIVYRFIYIAYSRIVGFSVFA